MAATRNLSEWITPVTELPLPERKSAFIRVGRFVEGFYPSMPEWWVHGAFEAAKRRKSLAAVPVALVLWRQFRMRRLDSITISRVFWDKLGLERKATNRAVSALESAGLISVQRYKHRSPLITILSQKGATGAKTRSSINRFLEEQGTYGAASMLEGMNAALAGFKLI